MKQGSKAPRRSEATEARYANAFQVGHSLFECLLDFGQAFSDRKGTTFHTRIVTAPVHAKAFAELLRGAIAQYEQEFGPIPKSDED